MKMKSYQGALTSVRQWLAVGGAALLSLAAQAADPWPVKPIRVVIPFTTGGVQDTLARSISNELGAALGQPVIIENRPGAGGTVASNAVAKSAPDGYTLILAAASHSINGTLYSKLNYDPVKDFVGAAYIGNTSYIMVVSASVPVKSVAEFVSYAKARPGQLNYATAGSGSATHLSMAYFSGMAGLDIVHIPTKGAGDAMTEVLAGRSQVMINANNVALPFAKDPRVRLLGVTSEKASPFVPGVEPIAAALPGYVFDSWFGLLAPAGTPPDIVNKLNTEMGKVLKRPEVIERLTRQGIEAGSMTPEAFAQLLRQDFDRMAKVVKVSGAKAD
ncbi:MAG: tripartite tricarboxylate transporter substrate binding protein [Betaproteobacteria bacterium]